MMISASHDMSALLAHTDALRIIDVLQQGGFDTRFVGGCVRDVLLKRPLGDIDLATTAKPAEVEALLNANNIRVIQTGIDHGTVTAVIHSQGYEITTLRQDIQTDGRHAQVMFTTDWEQDARRRDFTINALSVDRNGQVYDYCDGIADLHDKNLRFIDDAASRIAEDYLRMLRLFRFASVLGWEIRDTELLNLCRDLAPNMLNLSRERIQTELFKLLLGRNAIEIIDTMIQYGILAPWIGTVDSDKLQHVITIEETTGHPDAFRRFVALIGFQNETIIEKMIVMSRQQKKRLQDISHFANSDCNTWSTEKFCYVYGLQAALDCWFLFAPRHWSLDDIVSWQKPTFPLKAEHIIAYTDGANAFLGSILKQSEAWWIDQQFLPDLKALQNYALDLIKTKKSQN